MAGLKIRIRAKPVVLLAAVVLFSVFSCRKSEMEIEYSMKAAWDWIMPRGSAEEERDLVELARNCGFNTIILKGPSSGLIDYAHQRGLKVLDVLYPWASNDFVMNNPGCLQIMRSFEEGMAKYEDLVSTRNITESHREFLLVEDGNWYCFEHQESVEAIKRDIDGILKADIDGIALDYFGYKNHYACFCPRCIAERERLCSLSPKRHPLEIMAEFSEEGIITISRVIYYYIKSKSPDAIIACHIYPRFNPNPYYSYRFQVDYCAETVAWFFKPFWSFDRIRFEIDALRKNDGKRVNTFVPFVACFGQKGSEYLKKDPERLRREFRMALDSGSGRVMFATMGVLSIYDDLFEVVREELKATNH